MSHDQWIRFLSSLLGRTLSINTVLNVSLSSSGNQQVFVRFDRKRLTESASLLQEGKGVI
jgi:hypothetical protein